MKRRASAGTISLLVVLLAALVGNTLPAVASARPGWEEQRRSLEMSFDAKASNGYTISVETAGHKQVTMRLQKSGVSAMYRTTGRVSRKGIEADFGALGEIAVEFRGRPIRLEKFPGLGIAPPPGIFPQRKCRGRRPQQEAGTFHGVIRFEGENGFARFESDRVKGGMRRTYRRLCKEGPPRRPLKAKLQRAAASAAGAPHGGLYMNVLVATAEQEGRKVYFMAFEFSGTSGDALIDDLASIFGPLAGGATSEYRDGVLIQREGVSLGGEGSLIVSPPKRKRVTATVAFPKPFEGTAGYQRVPGYPPSWIGSLAVRLPGVGPVPMTGAEMTTVFCRIPLTDDASPPCMDRVEEALSDGPVARALLR